MGANVLKVPNVGYMVSSRSTEGAWWLVSGVECSCPAHTPNCRHIREVAAFTRAEDAKFRRPVCAPHVSALVD